MPFVEGESLRSRLIRERRLPVEDALRIAHDVADALHYAHEHDVLHRDVKPENILLESGHAVVADFGVARAVSSAGTDTLTQTGQLVGTPSYMSPEQAPGTREIDRRSDVDSLGCVLYEMLAGATPHVAPTPQAVLAHVLTEPAPPVRATRPDVPAEVERLVATALAAEPDDRFATAGEFAAALEAGRVTARIYLLVGEPEKALDLLEQLLKVRYYLSANWLKIDPTFEPVRSNPRFERLIAAN